MKTQPIMLIGFAVAISFGSHAFAKQTTGAASAGAGDDRPMIGTVTGEPVAFSTQSEIEQTLADGTRIDRKSSTNRAFRDLQGRTRLEIYQNTKTPGSGDQVLIQVIITDPIANTGYSLNPRDHTASKISHPQPRIMQQTAPSPPSTSGPGRAAPGVEWLGTQTMEGLLVQGSRATRTMPAGASGNDRPITIVTERWVAADLHLPVLIKNSNPLTGDQTIRIFNIDRSDPDPSLFEVPPDYTIEASNQ